MRAECEPASLDDAAAPIVLPAPGLIDPRWMVPAGRAFAIALPLMAVADRTTPGMTTDAAFLGIVAWLLALRNPFTSRVTSLGIGPMLRGALGILVGLAAIAVAREWFPFASSSSKDSLALAAALIFVSSSTFEILVATRFLNHKRVMIAGTSEAAAALIEEIRRRPETGYQFVGTVADDEVEPVTAGPAPLGRLEHLEELVARERPHIVVLADGSIGERLVERLLDGPAPRPRIVSLVGFYEHAFGRVPVEHLSPAWFMGILHIYQKPYSRFSKRAFDLTLALLGLIVITPLLPAIALGVRLSGPGPILYRQVRLGEGGRLFRILKFRTMYDHAEQPDVPVWAAERDRRVTPIGSLLRRTRLDEVPQLWNVIRGEMSIVGPRPERPEFLGTLQREVPFWTRRHLVKPGLSGWAQLHRGYTADIPGTREKLSYDLYYLRHRSLLLDAAIAFKTVAVVTRGFGAR